MSERLVVGSDHGGFDLKKELVEGLREGGYEVTDIGTHSNDASDYPDYAHKAALGILAGKFDRGLLICGTGVGMSMSANRHSGIRAVCCSDVFTARYSRLHNNANVLCIGGRVVGIGLAWEIVKTWLGTEFSGEARHIRRVERIEMNEP